MKQTFCFCLSGLVALAISPFAWAAPQDLAVSTSQSTFEHDGKLNAAPQTLRPMTSDLDPGFYTLFTFPEYPEKTGNTFTGPIQAWNGMFYGVVTLGGANDAGYIYSLVPGIPPTDIHDFSGADDANPVSALLQAGDGYLYGTTCGAGATGLGQLPPDERAPNIAYAGELFRIAVDGTGYTVLHTFGLTQGGACPIGNLIQGTDGRIYGSTAFRQPWTGGQAAVDKGGAIWNYDPSSSEFTDMHDFDPGPQGHEPYGPLVEGSDGYFYGTTRFDNGALCNASPPVDEIYGCGTIFRIDSKGNFVSLIQIPSVTDATNPSGGLVENTDGNYYGYSSPENYINEGNVFRVTVTGTSAQIQSVASYDASAGQWNIGTPLLGRLQIVGSTMYGTDAMGGIIDYTHNAVGGTGSIWSVDLAGNVTNIYDIGEYDAPYQGFRMTGGLIIASDGNYYGSTYQNTLWQFVPTSVVYPVTITSSIGASNSKVGTPFTLSWTVNQGPSKTANNCYAFSDKSTQWTGQKTGSGQQQITESIAGTYYYGLTCSGDKTANVSVVVNGASLPDSSTALSATPTTTSIGQSVTLAANVTSASGQPTGSVIFSADGMTLGSVPLDNGVASLTANSNGISLGSYPIIATYSGSSSYKGSSSSPVTVTLSKASTSTVLGASPNPVTAPASATLTATVSRSGSGAKGIPSGTVTFRVGNLSLGSAKLSASGVATLTASSAGIPAGSYPITATYNGDSSDTPSASSAVIVTMH